MPPQPHDDTQAFRALDLLAEAVWPPAELVELAGWRCRLDRGVTRRANSVLPADWPQGAGEAALHAQIDEVESIFYNKKLQPCFQVTSQAMPAALDAVLAARGYLKEGASLVQGMRLLPGETAAPDGEVACRDRPSLGWLAVMAAGSSPAAAAVKADILARAKGAKLYVALGPGEAPLAIGAGLRAGETVWANAMYTVPEARGQGLAGRLLTAIADWARAQGIARLHLQVEADNPAARRLYGRFGFQALYPYHYRTLPRPAAAAGATERGTC